MLTSAEAKKQAERANSSLLKSQVDKAMEEIEKAILKAVSIGYMSTSYCHNERIILDECAKLLANFGYKTKIGVDRDECNEPYLYISIFWK